MARQYKRGNKGLAAFDDLKRAAKQVSEGGSPFSLWRRIRGDRVALKRFIHKTSKGEIPTTDYVRHQICDDNMELELANRIEKLADQFHGRP